MSVADYVEMFGLLDDADGSWGEAHNRIFGKSPDGAKKPHPLNAKGLHDAWSVEFVYQMKARST